MPLGSDVVELLGRETELATLELSVQQARTEASAVGVLGEAGIGKSALLGALRERAGAQGMLVLEGRAAEHERDVPFGLVVDALDDHVASLHPRRIEAVGPDLAAVLPAAAAVRTDGSGEPAAAAGAAERFRYHRAVRGLLELLGRERPVALLLDDLHWADDASVELVLHLLRRPPRAPLLLAFALRRQDPATRLLDAARSAPRWQQLEPRPLAPDAAHALVDSVADPALRDRVVSEAGGNPLFLEELARAARMPDGRLPSTLMAAVRLEIDVLPADSRTLIEGAAVAGDPFDPGLAAAAAALDPDEAVAPLDRLVEADVVRATGDGRGLAFRHPLVRRAVYDAAPPAWRLAAHERVAAALERRGAGAPARAYHVAQYARQGDDAAIALLAEAGAAAADTAPATAAHWYEAALRLLPDGDRERRGALLGPLALAQSAAGRLEQAVETLDAVLELLPPEAIEQRVQLSAAAASTEAMLGRIGNMRRRVLAQLGSTPEDRRALLELTLAYSQYYSVDYAAMHDWAALAVLHARDDEPTVRAAAEAMGGLARLLRGDTEAGTALIDAGSARLAAAGDDVLVGRIDDAYLIAAALLLADRADEALVPVNRAMALARSSRQDRHIPLLATLRCMMYQNRLALDDAMQDAEAAVEAARLLSLDGPLHQSLMMQAQVHWLRGERADAQRAGAECVEVAGRVEASTATVTSLCNTAAISVDEDPERCIREMVSAAGPLLERVDQSWRTWLLAQLVHAALALGRTAEAERWTAVIEERAALMPTIGTCSRAAGARAAMLLAGGEAAEAARLAGATADAAALANSRLDAMPALLIAGRAHAAAGDRDAAVAALQSVAQHAGQGGAGLFVEAAARELRRLGTRLSAESRRATAGDDLTERERAIAELVAQGRTNKQVAAAMFLSEKTIEHHLSRAYAKLGVRSRVELTARMSA